MTFNNKEKGFTLFEMLLVLVIITSVLLMLMTYLTRSADESKRDAAVLKYEQILNAGLAYYINYSAWPADMAALTTNNYLPNTPRGINNPWGQGFTFYNDATTGTFSICSMITAGVSSGAIEAGILAGRLPMAYVTTSCPPQETPPITAPAPADCTGADCALVSTVNIPGQNLNNARSVNFAGIYHNGACVPAPICPTTMKPSIVVSPVSVSGTYTGTTEVFPLSSFTAYARGKGGNGTDQSAPALRPIACTADSTSTTGVDCESIPATPFTSGTYWRVCLDVVTERGRIGDPGSEWKSSSGIIMAITRCVPNNEPPGSTFDVFQSF